ncbi:RluA family pseudouridine synthase [Neolewinella agarilytica]|uniref:Pseudouridine synthase n=1 Tax=Neolewinella agarilytica TaxID=478744 RepID=A0A1H9KCF1_9BACT|nr:RluA family pseudouridine synthase [Neolewinella agarilytica]SEQ96779.1 23S rRNA pseudouridine955/2504/2580 synthase/23S rRNA pseudouridine1911/1915/1917 synthase [Neolewinella agarilytica]
MKFEVLYHDDHLIVVNKPANLLSVPDRYDPDIPNLTALLGRKFGDPVMAVHRLDKPTSGVIVYARSPEAHRELNRQFQEREVDKVYHAIVDGQPPEEGDVEIDEPIARNPGQTGRMMVSNRGVYAFTVFKVMERFGHQFSLLGVQIFTGRTHQIRVHLNYAGYPLMVDPFYGKREEFKLSEIKRRYNIGKDQDERPLLSRVPLHASRLAFNHPDTGERVSFEATMPKDMRAVLNQLRKLGK